MTDTVVRCWSYDQHERRIANWQPDQAQVPHGRPSTFLWPRWTTTHIDLNLLISCKVLLEIFIIPGPTHQILQSVEEAVLLLAIRFSY